MSTEGDQDSGRNKRQNQQGRSEVGGGKRARQDERIVGVEVEVGKRGGEVENKDADKERVEERQRGRERARA